MRYHTIQCSQSQCCRSHYVQNQFFKVKKTKEAQKLDTKRQLGQFLLQLALRVQKGNKLPIVPI